MGETHGSTISFSFGIARIRVPAPFDDAFLFYHNFHFPGNGFGERFVVYPPKTNMTMENPPFEDVFPIENGDFQCHVSFQGCTLPETIIFAHAN